jgi:hypothetical protein
LERFHTRVSERIGDTIETASAAGTDSSSLAVRTTSANAAGLATELIYAVTVGGIVDAAKQIRGGQYIRGTVNLLLEFSPGRWFKAAHRGIKTVKSWRKARDGVPNGGDSTIFRQGTSRESPTRLNRKAQEAENSNIGIHGVSGSRTQTPGCSSASCSDLENAGFKVHDTPTRRDPNHVTIELPKPVTKDDAKLFNEVLGRQ